MLVLSAEYKRRVERALHAVQRAVESAYIKRAANVMSWRRRVATLSTCCCVVSCSSPMRRRSRWRTMSDSVTSSLPTRCDRSLTAILPDSLTRDPEPLDGWLWSEKVRKRFGTHILKCGSRLGPGADLRQKASSATLPERPPLPSLLLPPLPCHSSPFPSPPLEVGPSNPARGLGEWCKVPSGV